MRYIVRCVEERLEIVAKLKTAIPGLTIYQDIVRDPYGMSAFIVALRLAGEGPAVMLEDDIELCDNFCPRAEEIILGRPYSIINFFSFSDNIQFSRHVSGKNFSWTQCFYLPAGYGNRIADFYPAWDRNQKYGGFDWLVRDWLTVRQESYYVHVPSLVQHLNLKSVINPKRSTKRQSPTFVK
jgi:hypothetical protein